ncbi:hypothetical protein EGW08_011805, partial [Elysia chlorotica]
WGNATSKTGCQPCSCNGHADVSLGSCDVNGTCFCIHNTEGESCESCVEDYFGDPRNNGTCYKRCDVRTFFTNSYAGAIGDYPMPVESKLTMKTVRKDTLKGNSTHCLFIISPSPTVLAEHADLGPITYAINVTGDLQCGKNAVYVYDGIPEFISADESLGSRELGVYCGKNERQTMSVFATLGVATIFVEGDQLENYGVEFKCSYRAMACKVGCSENQVCRHDGLCVCKRGFFGPDCLTPKCPNDCAAELDQGRCQHGLCICKRGYTGADCTERASPHLPDLQLISDSSLALPDPSLSMSWRQVYFLPPHIEGMGPSPRAGHTLTACAGELSELAFLYGGYSPQEGVHDDVWRLNMTDRSWKRIRPRGERLSPGGRYYHSAAYVHLEKMIYVFGGFAHQQEGDFVQPTKSIWKFNILSYVWTKATYPPDWMPALVGHSLTTVGPTLLVVIGGFSVNHSFNDKVFEYNTSRAVMAWTEVKHRQMSGTWPQGLYGHSAVYDQFTDTIYLYGGYFQKSQRFVLSNAMFLYEVRQRKWSMPDIDNLMTYANIEARAFHASVHLGDFMAIIGGMSTGQLGQDLLLYRFGCKDYIKVNLKGFGQLSQATSALGLAAVAHDDAVYIFGGFD